MRKPKSIAFAVLVILAVTAATWANSVSFSGEQAPPENLRWRRQVIQIAVSSSLKANIANIKADSDIAGALRRSLDAWQNAANLEFQLTNSDKQNVSPSAAGDGVSLITIAATPENLLLFAKNPEKVSATTRVFFNKRGVITEADIVLNPYQQFSTDGTFGTFDLESVLTHELGHLLGLDHSPLISSTMHESYGRNGLYGLQNFVSRSLAASDIAAVRSLYGQTTADEKCCSAVAGKAIFANGKTVNGAKIWLEEQETGRVESLKETASDGSFRFDGLANGNYRIYTQDNRSVKMAFPAQVIGEVSVGGVDETAATAAVRAGKIDQALSFIGFNGQLSDLAVPVNAGGVYNIYVGGKLLDTPGISFGFTSPFLSIVPNTLRPLDYGDGVSVVTFQIRVDPSTPDGDYSIFVRSDDKSMSFIPGGISVGDSPNPFSIYSIQKF
jgi:hypothetical protein